MKFISVLTGLLLVLLTAGAGLFYIGSQEQHQDLLRQYLWWTLALRFAFASGVGLVGVGFWWLVVKALTWRKARGSFNLRKTAWLLVASVLTNAFVSALLFCFR